MSISGVVSVNQDFTGLRNMFYEAIMDKLGDDKAALKALDVEMYQPATVEEGMELEKIGKRLFNVSGALGLNDSGDGWKVFQVPIEEGLADAVDKEIADKLAHQCLICVAKMKREASKASL